MDLLAGQGAVPELLAQLAGGGGQLRGAVVPPIGGGEPGLAPAPPYAERRSASSRRPRRGGSSPASGCPERLCASPARGRAGHARTPRYGSGDRCTSTARTAPAGSPSDPAPSGIEPLTRSSSSWRASSARFSSASVRIRCRALTPQAIPGAGEKPASRHFGRSRGDRGGGGPDALRRSGCAVCPQSRRGARPHRAAALDPDAARRRRFRARAECHERDSGDAAAVPSSASEHAHENALSREVVLPQGGVDPRPMSLERHERRSIGAARAGGFDQVSRLPEGISALWR